MGPDGTTNELACIGMVPDEPLVAIRFATADQVPIAIAMDRNLTKVAIERLEQELQNLDKPQPHHRKS